MQVEAVAAAILDHLSTHPLAADSVHGVARWWLGIGHASATLQQVEQALNLLVARRAMRRVKLLDGTFLYSQTPPTRQ
jgi:hypothetical protein